MNPSMKYKLENKNLIVNYTTLSLRTRELKLGIFDINFNLVAGPFNSYNETTKNTSISSGSISKYIKNKNLFKDRCYIFEF